MAAAGESRTSRSVYVLWAIGLALLLAIGIFCLTVAHPFLAVRALVTEINRTGTVPANAIERLGGKAKASRAVSLYLRAPLRWAPHREEAVYLLSHCGPEMLPTLRLALKSNDGATRTAAVRLAEHLGAAGTPLAPELIDVLGDWNASVWLHATKALGAMHVAAAKTAGARWVPRTTWRYSCDHRGRILGLAEPSFAPFYASAWPPPVPLSAEMARRVAEVLSESLGDRDEEVVATALETRNAMGECAAPAAPALAKLAQSGPENLRVDAAAVLAQIGPAAAEITSALAACLKDQSEDLRINAVLGLAAIVTDRHKLEELLKECSQDPSPKVREAVGRVLGGGKDNASPAQQR